MSLIASESTVPEKGHQPYPASTPDSYIHLRAAGVSVLLDLTGGNLPAVLHWGRDLGPILGEEVAALALGDLTPGVPNTADLPMRIAVLPEHHQAWTGRPGISGHRDGADWSPSFTVSTLHINGMDSSDAPEKVVTMGAGVVTVLATDPVAGLSLRLTLEMLSSGLFRSQVTITNQGSDQYVLNDLAIALPIPSRAREILDFAGRWGKERVPQRRELVVGLHQREGRKGRTGADAATVLSVGTPGFGFGEGEVWGIHVGFSGNHRHYAERLSTGAQVIGGGELLLPGEVRLAEGQEYQSPWVYAAYGRGLDEQAARFHNFLRSRPSHPDSARPVTLNVWEAVYFDHNEERLRELATLASSMGVERYVLDDGWFRHRRDDSAGLGDWYVDEDIWPRGLHPLVHEVRAQGMEFGLWFEPEMINEDSDLARAHPDWIMATGHRLPVASRNQQVLDLGVPEAYEYILERLTSIVTEYSLTYIKWDHNRDLTDAGTGPQGRAGVHQQTHATYRLMQELRRRFPLLEIESCSSGGARVDLGIIEHTDRVWVSDCIDPLERQLMNRWTMQLLPPEYLGSHVASGASHTTGRMHKLSFRAGTAVFGHFGIEWDLAQATPEECAELSSWIAFYKEHREIMHSGTVIRVDQPDDDVLVYGTVAPDQTSGIFFVAYVGRSQVSPRGRFILRGLLPDQLYRIQPVSVAVPDHSVTTPAWFGPVGGSTPSGALHQGVTVSGATLMTVGLQLPAAPTDSVFPFFLRSDGA